MSDSIQRNIFDKLSDVIVAINNSGGGGGSDATAANQVIGNNYLLTISTSTATAANQVTANNFLSPINSNVSNIKDNVANVLPFIGLDTTAIRAQLPASLGAKTAANSLSVTPASNATFTLTAEAGFLTVRTQALTNTAQTIKSSSGSVMGWNFININSVAVYIKFYNALIADVTVGTTTPVLTVAVPAGSATNPGINMVTPDLVPFEVFSTAISFACVTGLADNSNTAPATAIHASVRYK